MKVDKHIFTFCFAALFIAMVLFGCKRDKSANTQEVVESLYSDTISTSYTVALPDSKGEGMRITYTFFNLQRADSGNFRMTHVYMRHTGTDDTTMLNGTWKLLDTDSGRFILAYSGRRVKTFKYEGAWNLNTWNNDSMTADTGMLRFRQKKDNDLQNSTVVLEGQIIFKKDKSAFFIDESGDTLPILKIAAFPELIEMNNAFPASSAGLNVQFLGTIQIRMSMDGKSTMRSIIVEEIGVAKK